VPVIESRCESTGSGPLLQKMDQTSNNSEGRERKRKKRENEAETE
jgi:hypothetical protein